MSARFFLAEFPSSFVGMPGCSCSNPGYSAECRICGGVMENDNTSKFSSASDVLPMLDYAYTHEQTQATTGYFSCVPPEDLDFDRALERLEAAPMDDFLHLHLLKLLAACASRSFSLCSMRAPARSMSHTAPKPEKFFQKD